MLKKNELKCTKQQKNYQILFIQTKNIKRKNQQSIFSKNEITIFYYRADNIAGKDMVSKKKDGQRLNYESILNDGNWYLILDEAHKGEKETSKRQQYFMALTKNGFLFNFSATFTDDLDITTTIFDYKLDTFLKDGYGKKLYVADSNFQNFNRKNDDDFSNLENYPFVQCWINSACPRIGTDDIVNLDKPLINIREAFNPIKVLEELSIPH